MKRWNGWGDDSINVGLPEDGIRFLKEITGEPTPPEKATRDITYEEALRLVGPSRLEGMPGVDTSAEARLWHARGQSLPDWLSLRQGIGLDFPDAVAFPESEEDVRRLLTLAAEKNAVVMIYGGGTSVVGHINRPKGDRAVLVLDLSRMNRLLHFDPISRLARFQAGVAGPDVERQLAPHGMMLGHFPQSYEYSTLGGWVAARSSGQQSLYYGRIEDQFAGGRVITADAEINLPLHPASAAGPDLRQVLLGSEGRMGVITEVTVRARPIPEAEEFHGVFFPDWKRAEAFARAAVQNRLPLSMMRLSSARETFVTLSLAGHASLIKWMERYLALRGIGEGKCLLIVGFTGTKAHVSHTKKITMRLASKYNGVSLGQKLGSAWKKNRFRGPYMRNSLWVMGWAVDTLETAVPWDKVTDGVSRIEEALQKAAMDEAGERLLVYTHLSHLYGSGSAIYTTYVFRAQATPEKTLQLWKRMKDAASRAIVEMGGTISHQHGVGRDHSPYLPAEKGEVGMKWLESMIKTADPKGLFDTGNLTQR